MTLEKGRVGIFFLFVGLFILVIFFFSDQAESPQFDLFLAGFITTLLGVYLIRRDWKAPQPSGRFRVLHKKPKQQKTE